MSGKSFWSKVRGVISDAASLRPLIRLIFKGKTAVSKGADVIDAIDKVLPK